MLNKTLHKLTVICNLITYISMLYVTWVTDYLSHLVSTIHIESHISSSLSYYHVHIFHTSYNIISPSVYYIFIFVCSIPSNYFKSTAILTLSPTLTLNTHTHTHSRNEEKGKKKHKKPSYPYLWLLYEKKKTYLFLAVHKYR